MLTSGFSEANTDSQNTIRQYAHKSEYDYDSDSDLDEFEEHEDARPSITSPSEVKATEESEDVQQRPSTTMGNSTGKKVHQVFISNMAHRTYVSSVPARCYLSLTYCS